MKSMALILLSLWLVAKASDQTFFLELRNAEFGKTIIETIQLELGSKDGDAPSRILSLLKQMREDIQAEQKSVESHSEAAAADCKQRISDVQKVLTFAREKKGDDERKLPLLKEEQKDKRQQADDKLGVEQRNQDRIQALVEVRKRQRTEYEARRDELIGLVATLQEAKTIVQQLKGTEGVFAEIRNHHDKFRRHYPKQEGYHGMVNLLLETLTNADPKGVQKIVEVIDNLVESIYEVQKQELKAEDQRQQDFQNEKARLELQIRRLEGTIAQLRARVEQISQKVLELQNDIATQQQIINNKTVEENDWNKTCEDNERGVVLSSQSRKEQLEVIEECIVIFETRWNKDTQEFLQRLRIE